MEKTKVFQIQPSLRMPASATNSLAPQAPQKKKKQEWLPLVWGKVSSEQRCLPDAHVNGHVTRFMA